MTVIRTVPLALIVLLAACAKQEPPPGTPPDQVPPRPVDVRPEYGAVIPGFDGAARVRFDEPLTNPRNVGRDIIGSPAGRYEVSPGRRGFDVRPEEGWQPDVVYYLRLPAGVTDLLRNSTTEPIEWLFSTGGEIADTEVTGRVVDRVTARGTSGIRVLFRSADSIPYTTVSDTGGVFRLPGLPYATYEVTAFQDQSRDFAYDPLMEPGGTDSLTLEASSPTAHLELLVLPADTTPPVLSDAVSRDSLTLRLNFDDPLDPEADLAGARVVVRDTMTGGELEVAAFTVGELPPEEVPLAPGEGPDEEGAVERDADVPVDTLAAPADTLGARADTLAAPVDTVVVPADTAVAPPAEPDAEALDLEPASTFVSVRLAAPLAPGIYAAEIAGVANLRGLAGGGSATFEYVRPEPEPEPEPGDEGQPDAGDDGERDADEPDDEDEPAVEPVPPGEPADDAPRERPALEPRRA